MSFNSSQVNSGTTNHDPNQSIVHLSLYNDTLADLRGDITEGRMGEGWDLTSTLSSRRSSSIDRRRMIVSIIDEALSIVNEIDIEHMLSGPEEPSESSEYSSSTDATRDNGRSNNKDAPSE